MADIRFYWHEAHSLKAGHNMASTLQTVKNSFYVSPHNHLKEEVFK
jgi:hypothetical protein